MDSAKKRVPSRPRARLGCRTDGGVASNTESDATVIALTIAGRLLSGQASVASQRHPGFDQTRVEMASIVACLRKYFI
jgi:hypothetical protein